MGLGKAHFPDEFNSCWMINFFQHPLRVGCVACRLHLTLNIRVRWRVATVLAGERQYFVSPQSPCPILVPGLQSWDHRDYLSISFCAFALAKIKLAGMGSSV